MRCIEDAAWLYCDLRRAVAPPALGYLTELGCSLLDALHSAFYLPIYLSKSCEGRSRLLYKELCPPPDCRLPKCSERLNPRPLLPRDVPWRI